MIGPAPAGARPAPPEDPLRAVAFAVFCAAALVWLGDPRASAVQAVTVLLAWGFGIVALRRPQGGPWAVLVAAVVVRAILLRADPGLSDDLYRYLWEGRVVAEGGNPYLSAPADPVWDAVAVHDAIRARVNHPEVTTIYPPLALELFSALARVAYHPMSVRVFFGLCDALVAWTLARVLAGRGRTLDGAWLYALLPLGAVESAVSGHLEAAAILPLLLAIRAWDKGRSGLGWAGLGALVKLMPALVVPALWRRSPWLLALVVLVGVVTALPFVDAGPALLTGLNTYARHWSFNGSFFPLFEHLLGERARPLCMALAAAAVGWAWWRHRDPARVALWVGGAFVLFSPTVHPWYVLWAWVPALVVGVRAWTLLAVLTPIAYIVLATLDPVTGVWEERYWPAVVEYLPFLVALGVEALRHAQRPGPWSAPRLAAR